MSKESPLGIPGLTHAEICTISRSNLLLFRILSLGWAVHVSGGFVGVENPEEWDDTVAIWELEVVIQFLEEIGAIAVSFDQEPWGATTVHPTKVASTLQHIKALELRIQRERGAPGPPREPRTFLGGSPPEPVEAPVDYHKRVRHSTAFYPPGLTDRIVDIMVDHLHDAQALQPRPQGEAPENQGHGAGHHTGRDHTPCERASEEVPVGRASGGPPIPGGQHPDVVEEPLLEKRWVSKHKKAVEDMMKEDTDEQWISQHLGCKTLPEIVQVGSKYRPFADGGGLCSLGRWLPHTRGPRRATKVREEVVIEVGKLHLPSKLKAAALRGFKPCTAASRCGQQGCVVDAPCLREAPWDQQEVDKAVLQAIDRSMNKGGQAEPGRDQASEGQPFRQCYVHDLLELIDDPEKSFFVEAATEGMHMGVDVEMPRTPKVFREKTKWRIKDGGEELCDAETNYPTVERFKSEVIAKLQQMVDFRRVAKATTKKEAAHICGCREDELIIQKLGVKEEGKGKLRTYLDCTITHENGRIKARDQVECPGLAEQEAVMVEAKLRGREGTRKYGMLKYDINAAHNLVKKKRTSWRFLVVFLDGVYYIFMVGAFGDGSAGYSWARVYGCFHRLLYHLGRADSWGCVFADDSLWNLALEEIWEEAAYILAILTALGVPMSWKKTGVGLALPWVGFDVTYSDWEIGILESKVVEVATAADALLMPFRSVYVEDYQTFVGKLTNMVQAIMQLSPLLQPLHALMGALRGVQRVTLPAPVKRAIRAVIARIVAKRMRPIRTHTCWAEGWGASDGSGGIVRWMVTTQAERTTLDKAMVDKASITLKLQGGAKVVDTAAIFEVRRKGAKKVEEGPEEKRRRLLVSPLPLEIHAYNPPAIGGWWTHIPRAAGVESPAKGEVEWFAALVDLDVLPCVLASSQGGPQDAGTSSMTIELLGHLVLVDLRTRDLRSAGGQVSAGILGDMDSLGATYAVAKLYTPAEPGASVIRHMAELCADREVWPSTSWVRREFNTWADDLSKLKTLGFSPAREHKIDWNAYADIQKDHERFSLRPRMDLRALRVPGSGVQ